VENVAGPFFLDFQLNDGGGAVNNTVTLNHFNFGDGSASGNPTLTEDASGDLSGTLTLTDSAFWSEFSSSSPQVTA
jgi:hypothetical protein